MRSTVNQTGERDSQSTLTVCILYIHIKCLIYSWDYWFGCNTVGVETDKSRIFQKKYKQINNSTTMIEADFTTR